MNLQVVDVEQFYLKNEYPTKLSSTNKLEK